MMASILLRFHVSDSFDGMRTSSEGKKGGDAGVSENVETGRPQGMRGQQEERGDGSVGEG